MQSFYRCCSVVSLVTITTSLLFLISVAGQRTTTVTTPQGCENGDIDAGCSSYQSLDCNDPYMKSKCCKTCASKGSTSTTNTTTTASTPTTSTTTTTTTSTPKFTAKVMSTITHSTTTTITNPSTITTNTTLSTTPNTTTTSSTTTNATTTTSTPTNTATPDTTTTTTTTPSSTTATTTTSVTSATTLQRTTDQLCVNRVPFCETEEFSAAQCYTSDFFICCAFCSRVRDNSQPGCEYGDRYAWCNSSVSDSDCSTSEVTRRTCCRRCKNISEIDPNCQDTPGLCDYVDPSQCYNSWTRQSCCRTCKLAATGPPGCEYGDRYTGCSSSQSLDCTDNNLKSICCKTCAPDSSTTISISTTTITVPFTPTTTTATSTTTTTTATPTPTTTTTTPSPTTTTTTHTPTTTTTTPTPTSTTPTINLTNTTETTSTTTPSIAAPTATNPNTTTTTTTPGTNYTTPWQTVPVMSSATLNRKTTKHATTITEVATRSPMTGTTDPLCVNRAPFCGTTAFPALQCYTTNYVICCAFCARIRDDSQPGCEYGDRYSWCTTNVSASDCSNSDATRRTCCKTCKDLLAANTKYLSTLPAKYPTYLMTSSTTSPTTTSTTTTTPSSATTATTTMIITTTFTSTPNTSMIFRVTKTNKIELDPSCQDKPDFCEYVDPSQCYNPGMRQTCCRTCKLAATGPPGCEYGDAYAICVRLGVSSCEMYKQDCCQTCRDA